MSWSSSNEAVIPSPSETGTTVTVAAERVSPIDSSFTPVYITASFVIDGRPCSGRVTINVWRSLETAQVTVRDWDSLTQALEDGYTVIDVAGTVEIPADTTLDLSDITLLRASGFIGALLSVKETGITVISDGTGVMNGQFISANAPLISVEETGELTLSDVLLEYGRNTGTGGNSGSQGGAVAAKGGSLTCENVTFDSNVAYGNVSADNTFNGGGAIYATDAVINVAGCAFTDNTAEFGNGGAIYADQDTTGVMEGNTFTGNKTSATAGNNHDGDGGAIYCRLAGDLLISGNTIADGQAAGNGGGIAVMISDYEGCGVITLAENTVTGNVAENRGGGLYLVQNKPGTIDLQSGTISGNSADWGGGIDYTVHNQETLALTNVLITGNTAVRGAGVWACPTSETESYATLGGAIFGNTATGAAAELNPISASGDDIRYEGVDADVHREDALILQGNPWMTDTTNITVLSRALGGGLMQWYQDEQADRYADGDLEADPSLYTDTNLSFGLHGELAETYQQLARDEATLIIKNNTATSRGGGIATNSPIIIGQEGYDKAVTVEKVWSEEEHPDSASVTLVRVDAEGKSVDLETVTLNAENGWTHTFEDLPGLYEDENGVEQAYTYTVREAAMENWTGTVEVADDGDQDDNTILLQLTNTYQEPTTEEPSSESESETPDPSTPSESIPDNAGDANTPSTGDSGQMQFWLALCVIAAVGLGTVVIVRNRRNRNMRG